MSLRDHTDSTPSRARFIAVILLSVIVASFCPLFTIEYTPIIAVLIISIMTITSVIDDHCSLMKSLNVSFLSTGCGSRSGTCRCVRREFFDNKQLLVYLITLSIKILNGICVHTILEVTKLLISKIVPRSSIGSKGSQAETIDSDMVCRTSSDLSFETYFCFSCFIKIRTWGSHSEAIIGWISDALCDGRSIIG